MTHDVSLPVTGADGELIERLLALLEREPPGTHLWAAKLAPVLGAQLGGCLAPLHLDVGIAYDEATLGAAVREGRKSVALSVYLAEMRNRLKELVASGMSESFVVVAARNYLSDFLGRMADLETFQQQRDEQQNALLRRMDAPDTDEETIADLRRILEVVQATGLDEPAARVADKGAWADASTLVSDDVIDEWSLLRWELLLRKGLT
jgi:hypothetical protein